MRNIAILLALVFIFVIPSEKILLLPGLGSVARIIGVITMAAWLASVLLRGSIRPVSRFHGVVFLFVLWQTASIFWTVDADATLARAITWVQLALLIVLIWDLITTPMLLTASLQAYVLGAFLSATGIVYNYLNATEFVYGRYSAAGQHSVNLGLILAIGMPIAWYLAIQKQQTYRFDNLLRMINFLYLPVASIGIALTGSRGAMIAALPTLFFILTTQEKLRPWARIVFLLVAIGGGYAAMSLVPQSSFDRLGTAYTELSGGGNLTGRTLIWDDAIARIMENPILGVGSDAFRSISKTGLVAHNSFLSVWVETGIVGLMLFLTVLLIALLHIFTMPRLERKLWLIVLMCWFLGVSALTYEQHKPTWLVLALIMATRSSTRSYSAPDHSSLAYPYDIIEFNDEAEEKNQLKLEDKRLNSCTDSKNINKHTSTTL